jgi:cell division protein ZipA
MEPLRWVLLLIGVIIVALILAQSRGVFPSGRRVKAFFAARRRAALVKADESAGSTDESDAEPVEEVSPEPALPDDSRVVTVRILPQPDAAFPAEDLILALRSAGLRHGKFKIFHSMSEDESRIRYSVASLVEPGSFDLSKLTESEYQGISIFAVLPAPEDGVALFDEMLGTARDIAKDIDGRLVDGQGGTLSMQRERYMREEVIEYLRLRLKSSVVQDDAAIQ